MFPEKSPLRSPEINEKNMKIDYSGGKPIVIYIQYLTSSVLTLQVLTKSKSLESDQKR